MAQLLEIMYVKFIEKSVASKPFLANHAVVYLLCDTLTIILTFKHSKMANERTFLSWIRTALMFLTFSIDFTILSIRDKSQHQYLR